MSDIVQFKIGKTRARLVAQWQEMIVLSSVNNPAHGNEGLRRTASLLFNPLLNFYTAAGSTRDVAASISSVLNTGGYVAGLSNTDTMEKKNTYIDNESLEVSLVQDPDIVRGCFDQGTLKTYVTLPPVALNMPSIVRLCPGFLLQEAFDWKLAPTTPVRKCQRLWDDPKGWLSSSKAKTVVDLAVAKDPYYEYERALLQTRPSNLNNGGVTRVPFFQKIVEVIKTPDTDGWKAWRKNLGSDLVVPAAVAALSTLMEQQRYCRQTPEADGTFQPSPGTQQGWITWVSDADPDWV
ncbi:hypothetical protein HO133_001946 [Letharia lupina]|uniref:Uncharacterized protein n=1 Tax=Letharia lupina TaxID=560253 RepID=A0A8H6CEM0_9LECA|nr:uncharacterized protein HO133_001946 [Letharia lupina]KAF6221978.1 hypothetical protein HO133_001946 [Letharia lupina]